MAIIKWFIWRRWVFRYWVQCSRPEPLLSNCFKCNVASCRTYPIIHRDMQRIMGVSNCTSRSST
ncbi:hypothetical protein BSQ96_02695 [Serratia proteamaculans]|nr:hypothetical protein BSQ96_02695 [Serratia proteamaculans]